MDDSSTTGQIGMAEPPLRFRVGDWLVDGQLDEITRGGQTLKLEPRMVRLLVHLAQQPGQVVSTRHLLERVWSDVVVGPASVYQAVSQLRKLLGDTGPTPAYIATVPRKGYRLIATAIPQGTPDPDPLPAMARGRRFPSRLALGATVILAFTALASWVPGGTPTRAATQKLPSAEEQRAATYTAWGEGAEGIRLAEQALRMQPQSAARAALINWYVDFDLPEAATELAYTRPFMNPSLANAQIAMRRGDLAKAALLAEPLSDSWQLWGFPAPGLAHAVRDDAIARGKIDEAVELLGIVYANARSAPGWQRADLTIVYAHTLILAGRRREGEALARQLVSEIGSGYGALQRAALFELLGKDEAALTELELSIKGSHSWGWWYVVERDPLFARLRSNARFAAVAEQSRRYYAEQRVRLEKMIAEGSVPRRNIHKLTS